MNSKYETFRKLSSVPAYEYSVLFLILLYLSVKNCLNRELNSFSSLFLHRTQNFTPSASYKVDQPVIIQVTHEQWFLKQKAKDTNRSQNKNLFTHTDVLRVIWLLSHDISSCVSYPSVVREKNTSLPEINGELPTSSTAQRQWSSVRKEGDSALAIGMCFWGKRKRKLLSHQPSHLQTRALCVFLENVRLTGCKYAPFVKIPSRVQLTL